MPTVQVDVPDELLALIGSPEALRSELKEALVLNLVRRGRLSRSKAAELLGVNLWDLPELLARYAIPWFHYSRDDIQQDLQTLQEYEKSIGQPE